jgi:uncharacterized protein YkwD
MVEYNSPRAGWDEIPAVITLEGNAINFALEAQDQIDGEFRVTIPAGTYLVDGIENEEIVDTLVFANIQAYTATPVATNSKNLVSAVSPITLTFTNATEVADNPNADYWTQYAVVEYNSPRAGWGEIPAEPTIEGNTISFKLEEQDQIDGEFRLTIPAGTYLLDGIENQEIVLNFLQGELLTHTVTPVVNSKGTVNVISPIVVTYTNADTVEDNPNADYYLQYAVVEYNSPRAGWGEIPAVITLEGNAINFALEAQDQIDGEFRVTIPAGTYLVDGIENEEIVDTLVFANIQAYTVTPTDTTATISPIVVTFTNADEVIENPEADFFTYPSVTYTSAKAGECEAEIEVTESGNQISIAISEQDLASTGDFTLTIPAGAFLVDGVENEAIVVTITYAPETTAIESILSDARKAGRIYNLQGVHVDAKAVTPGIYVIDGKKVMLR